MTSLFDALTTEFLVTALVVVLIPGTGVIYTLSHGVFVGARASVAAAFGCTLGIIPHLLASILGVAALLHASAVAFQIVKFLGIAYLLYLAWGLWRETGTLALERSNTAGGRASGLGAIAVRGALINVLNPKLSIFFLAFLPQFVPATAPDALMRMGLLSATFMALTFGIFVIYGIAANAVSNRLLSSKRVTRWIQRTFAGLFAAFAAKLAFADR